MIGQDVVSTVEFTVFERLHVVVCSRHYVKLKEKCWFLFLCFNLKVAEVVQFILIKDQKKIPIRRTGESLSHTSTTVFNINTPLHNSLLTLFK